jgi:hypothetical protein
MTMFLAVTIDQPEGTVNVAPPGDTRGVSAATFSGADFASACGCGAGLEADAAPGAKAANARKVIRAGRYSDIDMGATKFVKIRELRNQRYTQLDRVVNVDELY